MQWGGARRQAQGRVLEYFLCKAVVGRDIMVLLVCGCGSVEACGEWQGALCLDGDVAVKQVCASGDDCQSESQDVGRRILVVRW